MRNLSSSAAAAIEAGRIATIILVEMLLSETMRLCGASRDIEYGGYTWYGINTLGSIGAISDTAGELEPLEFSLLAADPQIVAIALGEPTQGKAVYVYSMLLDADTHALLNVDLVWSGTLEPLTYQEQYTEDGVVPLVNVRAEHAGVAAQRPRPLRYTDADQQRLYPGDPSLEYMVAQAVHDDVWPAASFFEQ